MVYCMDWNFSGTKINFGGFRGSVGIRGNQHCLLYLWRQNNWRYTDYTISIRAPLLHWLFSSSWAYNSNILTFISNILPVQTISVCFTNTAMSPLCYFNKKSAWNSSADGQYIVQFPFPGEHFTAQAVCDQLSKDRSNKLTASCVANVSRLFISCLSSHFYWINYA
jgi:hypothetical protein